MFCNIEQQLKPTHLNKLSSVGKRHDEDIYHVPSSAGHLGE